MVIQISNFLFVIFETTDTLDTFVVFQQNGAVAPHDFFPFQAGVDHLDDFILEGTLILGKILVVDPFGVLDLAQFEDVEDFHVDF